MRRMVDQRPSSEVREIVTMIAPRGPRYHRPDWLAASLRPGVAPN